MAAVAQARRAGDFKPASNEMVEERAESIWNLVGDLSYIGLRTRA